MLEAPPSTRTVANILMDVSLTPAQACAFLDWLAETFAHENAYVHMHAKFKNAAYLQVGLDPPFTEDTNAVSG